MSTALRREDLHQVQLVPLTAFNAAGDLNLQTMRQHTMRMLEAGVRVFIPCAGSSEFHSLLADEIIQAVRMTREVVGDRARVIVPVGLQLPYAVKLGQQAREAGADALLIMPLSFPYISNEGARDYYEAVMNQVGLPTLIYKKDAVPADSLLLELADHPHMIGVKYSVNDLSQFQATVTADGGRVDWFCGSAERFAPYFALAGSPGYTSGAGNLCPRLTLALHASLAAKDYDEALRLQKIIVPIEAYRARSENSYNVSFLKYAARHVGLDFGPPRPPYRRLTDGEQQEIDRIMEPILAAEREMGS